MANRFLSDFENDERFIKNLYNEINSILNAETQKPEDEMDMDLINDCVDALLYLEHYDENAYSLTDKTVKKFHTRLQVTKLLRTSGTLVAALIIAIAVIGIALSSNNDSYISEVETTTHVVAIEPATDKKDDTTSTTKKNKEKSTSASSKTKKNTSSKKKKSAKSKHSEKKKEKESSTKAEERTSEKEQGKEEPETEENTTEKETKAKTTKAINSVKKVVSIKGVFSRRFKSVYLVGEKFDPKGIEVACTYSDNSTAFISLEECEIRGFDSSKPGTNTVYVSYGTESFSFKVTIALEYDNSEY